VVRAIIFDLDNTLTDFMKMKADAVNAAIDGMIDAGLKLPRDAVQARIDAIYKEQGLEYQQVFVRLEACALQFRNDIRDELAAFQLGLREDTGRRRNDSNEGDQQSMM